MESKDKLAELRATIELFAQQKRRYIRDLHFHTFSNQETDPELPPQPSSLEGVGAWILYNDLMETYRKKQSMESALLRCERTAEYLTKLVQRNSPNIVGRDQWLKFVHPYDHCQCSVKVDFFNLSVETVAIVFAKDLARQIFNFTGGDYSAAYVELRDGVSGHLAIANFFFVK